MPEKKKNNPAYLFIYNLALDKMNTIVYTDDIKMPERRMTMGLKESWMNVFKDTVRLGRDLVTGTVETFRFGAEKINDWLNEEAAK